MYRWSSTRKINDVDLDRLLVGPTNQLVDGRKDDALEKFLWRKVNFLWTTTIQPNMPSGQVNSRENLSDRSGTDLQLQSGTSASALLEL